MKSKWQCIELGKVCEVIAGQSPEGRFYNPKGKGVPFYQGKKEFNQKYLGEPTTWTTKVTKEAQPDDILMSVRAPVGPVNFSTRNICIGRGLAAIRPSKLIDKEFLFYFLQNQEDQIVSNAGAVFASINKAQIENITIPLPPLAEQQRIVTILDESFTAIDQARENTKRNLRTTHELFESYLESIFSKPSKGWEEKIIENCFIVRSGDFLPNRLMVKEGSILVYGGNGISGNHNKFNLSGDNIIIGRVGEKCGNVRLVTGNVWVTDNAFYISKYFEEFDLKYLEILLSFLDLRKSANQAAQPVISYTTIKNINLIIPPLAEQHSIVAKFEKLFTETKKLEANYLQKLAALDELKKSLLQKAFNGEL